MNLQNIGPVTFPEPTGISVNMMPFVMGDESTIPQQLRGYVPIAAACLLEHEQVGRVGYLSIVESQVTAHRPSQRRPGIHTEKHPNRGWGGGWGGPGHFTNSKRDGFYMTSTVSNSCRAWDTHIDVPGEMGDCEHLRERLTDPIHMVAGQLYWMTDSCPHESLPLEPGTFRQWFRLVTHKVGLWYEQHSTPSQFGVMPECPIVYGNKFD